MYFYAFNIPKISLNEAYLQNGPYVAEIENA